MQTRFAPSPTGVLHRGHAFAALYIRRYTDRLGGACALRIDDLDHTRCRPELTDAVLEDLSWLGMSWDGPVWHQSNRTHLYEEALNDFIEQGWVYRCFLSRGDLKAWRADKGPTAPLPRPTEEEIAEGLAEGIPYAWRLDVRALPSSVLKEQIWQEETDAELIPQPTDLEACDGIILGRRDIGTSYHLASVVDDIALGVTHLVRGQDLRESAHIHALLFGLLGHKPPLFHHHDLILDTDGEKLAKRRQSRSLRDERDAGLTPATLRTELGF